MTKQKYKDYQYSFESSQTPASIFNALLTVPQWWSGLYGEEIRGRSEVLNDEFTFKAGDGAHYTKQRLIELVPNQKILWLVTESNLTFLEEPHEWLQTQFGFELTRSEGKTKVTFTHQGLHPEIECYKSCSSAWSAYMTNLAKRLK